MLVTIVYESMFGNTAALAGAVAVGLREDGADVTLLQAGAVDDHVLRGCDLLVLAAPTHALSLSRPATRADAVAQGAEPAGAVTGVREWMDVLDPVMYDAEPPLVAVFDTRARIARHWPGSAARRVARTMRGKGFSVIDRTSFFVDDVKGPLLAGERERATGWGRLIAQEVRRSRADRDADA